MSATTYTVYRADDPEVVHGIGLSARDAAHELLTADGYRYEIRPATSGLYSVLYVSDGSENSTRGARHMVSCLLGGYSGTEDEIIEAVILSDWHGLVAKSDKEYAAEQARLKAELEDDDEI